MCVPASEYAQMHEHNSFPCATSAAAVVPPPELVGTGATPAAAVLPPELPDVVGIEAAPAADSAFIPAYSAPSQVS